MDDESFSGVEPRPAPRGGFQFSLLALFLLTTVAAVLLGGIVALAAAFGVDPTDALLQAVGQQISHLPVLVVWLVGTVLLVNRRQLHPQASKYGACGFGGLLLLSMLSMGFQVFILAVMTNNRSMSSIAWVFAVYSFAYSALAAVCYGFLLAAILTRRTDDAVAGPPWQDVPRQASEP